MKNFITSASAWRKAATIGLATATLTTSMGVVCAQPVPQSRDGQSYGPYDGTNASPVVQAAPSRWDRAHFDRSGTRGREGLGASPLHPEGPGDVSD
jgi:hypothetical protein